MGRVGVVTLLLASLSIGACSSEQSFRVADGSSIRFSELRGDWVVLKSISKTEIMVEKVPRLIKLL